MTVGVICSALLPPVVQILYCSYNSNLRLFVLLANLILKIIYTTNISYYIVHQYIKSKDGCITIFKNNSDGSIQEEESVEEEKM